MVTINTDTDNTTHPCLKTGKTHYRDQISIPGTPYATEHLVGVPTMWKSCDPSRCLKPEVWILGHLR